MQTALQAHSSVPTTDSFSSHGMMMTPELICELINASLGFAFTSMGISGRCSSSTPLSTFHSLPSFQATINPSVWVLDLGASNHMTVVEHHLISPPSIGSFDTFAAPLTAGYSTPDYLL